MTLNDLVVVLFLAITGLQLLLTGYVVFRLFVDSAGDLSLRRKKRVTAVVFVVLQLLAPYLVYVSVVRVVFIR